MKSERNLNLIWNLGQGVKRGYKGVSQMQHPCELYCSLIYLPCIPSPICPPLYARPCVLSPVRPPLVSSPLYALYRVPSLVSPPLYALPCVPSPVCPPSSPSPCILSPVCPLSCPFPCISSLVSPCLFALSYFPTLVSPCLCALPYISSPICIPLYILPYGRSPIFPFWYLLLPPTPLPPPPHYLTGSQWQIKKARNGCHPSSMSLNSWFKLLKRKPLNESDQNNKVMGTNANLFICLFHTRGFKYISTDWEYRLKTGVLSHDSLTYTHINYVVFLLV